MASDDRSFVLSSPTSPVLQGSTPALDTPANIPIILCRRLFAPVRYPYRIGAERRSCEPCEVAVSQAARG
jgi:hypothetical protein